MQKRTSALLLIICMFLIGCTHQVQVVDPAGHPLQGAAVRAITLSTSGSPTMTDAKGIAVVPKESGLLETKWVDVTKTGFEPQQVAVPETWPLKVTLQPAKTRN